MKKSFNETTEILREDLLKDFEKLSNRNPEDGLSENEFDFYVTKHRSSALILKTLDSDLKKESLNLKMGHQTKQIQ